MKDEEKFEIILAKNRLARTIKEIFKTTNESYNRNVPEHIKADFDMIERSTGTMNQPSARDILESLLDI